MRNKLILVLAVCVFGLVGCNKESDTVNDKSAVDKVSAQEQSSIPAVTSDATSSAEQKDNTTDTNAGVVPQPQQLPPVQSQQPAEIGAAGTVSAPEATTPTPQGETPQMPVQGSSVTSETPVVPAAPVQGVAAPTQDAMSKAAPADVIKTDPSDTGMTDKDSRANQGGDSSDTVNQD